MDNNPIMFDDNVMIDQDGVDGSAVQQEVAFVSATEQDVDNCKDMLMPTQSAYKSNNVRQEAKGSRSNICVGLNLRL